MATIRKHRTKRQVQIRRTGIKPITKSFNRLEDAKAWARKTEVQADRADLPGATLRDALAAPSIVFAWLTYHEHVIEPFPPPA